MVKTQYQVVAIFRTVMLCKWGGWRWAFSRDDAKQKSLTQSLRILFYVVVIRNFSAGKVPQNLYINYPYFSTKATSLLYFRPLTLFSKQNHPAFLSTTCPTFVTNDPPYYMIRKRKEWYEKTTLRFFPKKQNRVCVSKSKLTPRHVLKHNTIKMKLESEKKSMHAINDIFLHE